MFNNLEIDFYSCKIRLDFKTNQQPSFPRIKTLFQNTNNSN